MANIAIFASGNGSNFDKLAQTFEKNRDNHVKLLICNKKNALVIERAKKYNIDTVTVNYMKYSQTEVEQKILQKIKERQINVIFLAGFMKILSAYFLNHVQIPVINIHPSLLPKYKGLNAIENAFAAREKESGITIHFVNEEVDGGKIICQKKINLEPEKGLLFLTNEIHNLEHHWYPEIARQICEQINHKGVFHA